MTQPHSPLQATGKRHLLSLYRHTASLLLGNRQPQTPVWGDMFHLTDLLTDISIEEKSC